MQSFIIRSEKSRAKVVFGTLLKMGELWIWGKREIARLKTEKMGYKFKEEKKGKTNPLPHPTEKEPFTPPLWRINLLYILHHLGDSFLTP
jgi:hypothetical protein